MMTLARHTITRALADRDGTTALEYAMIGSAVATVIVVCYKSLFDPMAGRLAALGFS